MNPRHLETTMFLNLTNNQIGLLAAAILVCPPWVWLAIRTKQFLQAVTRRSVPFTSRTIWLAKILALIVGAGNVFGFLVEFGAPQFLAIVAAGIIVALALREKVSPVMPIKPVQEVAVYRSAWLEYWRLRRVYKLSALGFVAAILLAVGISFFAHKLPPYTQAILTIIFLIALVLSIAFMSFSQWKWVRWPCPRCGCSFRGAWGSLWLPKTCAYCHLPREEKG